MFYAQKRLGWFFDYEKIYRFFTQGVQVYNAFFYTGVRVPPEVKDEGFLRALTHIGYTVRRKTIKRLVDHETGDITEKSNLDIEIVIDMFNTVELYGRAILFSGDGDFERAIELIRTKGNEVWVVSTEGMIAYELINSADRFFDLRNLREEIEKVRA